MTRILLADDSPHAQRMGERILLEEGFEVVSVTDGETALLRLADVDPDLIIADIFLPRRSGFDLCRHVRSEIFHQHVRIVLTAGLLEPFDEEEARRAGCDAILRKPFEASTVMRTVGPLIEKARLERAERDHPPAVEADEDLEPPPPLLESVDSIEPPPIRPLTEQPPEPEPELTLAEPLEAGPALDAGPESGAEVDEEQVRAAVTLAVEAALPAIVDELTERILVTLRRR